MIVECEYWGCAWYLKTNTIIRNDTETIQQYLLREKPRKPNWVVNNAHTQRYIDISPRHVVRKEDKTK